MLSESFIVIFLLQLQISCQKGMNTGQKITSKLSSAGIIKALPSYSHFPYYPADLGISAMVCVTTRRSIWDRLQIEQLILLLVNGCKNVGLLLSGRPLHWGGQRSCQHTNVFTNFFSPYSIRNIFLIILG